MNGVTTVLLSPILIQRIWNFCEDAEYLQVDGKTLAPLLYLFGVVQNFMCRISGKTNKLFAQAIYFR